MRGTARRKGLKGKPALPTASKTLAIWTPARPPPARHVPGAATRRGAREADGTEQTATVHSGGGWEAQGAAPGLTWTVSCARSSACSLSASCRRMAAASPPAVGAQCRRLSLPLGRKPNARPASSPCAALSRPTEQPRVPCSSCARSAPPHPRAGVRPPAGTPRNTTSSTHPTAGGSPACSPLLRSSPSSSLSSTAVTTERCVWKGAADTSEPPSASGTTESYGGRCPNAACAQRWAWGTNHLSGKPAPPLDHAHNKDLS